MHAVNLVLDGVLSPRVACTVSQSVAVVVERGLAAVSPIVRASHVVANFVWGKGREGRGRNKEECREVAECAEREVRSFLGCAIYTPRRIFSVYNTKLAFPRGDWHTDRWAGAACRALTATSAYMEGY